MTNLLSGEYEPKHLKPWTMPANYAGETWPAYYVFLVQNRDSDALTRSNFTCALERIGGESDTVQVVREGHWACGWVEWIAIHQDDSEALRTADEIAAGLEGYPVVSEDHWSELEYTEAADYWEGMSVRDRAYYCKRAGLSIYAARRNYLPSDDTGALQELLNGH
jgi:hypothetical protein